MKSSYFLMFFVIASSGAQTPQPGSSAESSSFTYCADPRPQICTRDYRPVCGQRDTGVRCATTPCPSFELQTYGNACTACSDPQVTGYLLGACANSAGKPQ